MNQDERLVKALQKKVKKLKERERELLDEVKHLGDIGDICTFAISKEICEGCRCKKRKII